jgi:hypothetical protein
MPLLCCLADLAAVRDEKHLQRPMKNQWAVVLSPLPPAVPAKAPTKQQQQQQQQQQPPQTHRPNTPEAAAVEQQPT